MPIAAHTTDDCFDALRGKLGFMPAPDKKWQSSLGNYRYQFRKVKDAGLRDSLARLRMSLDYQFSLYSWLAPKMVFDEHHKFVLVSLIVQIYEGILTELFQRELNSKLKKVKKLERMHFGELLSMNREMGNIDDVLEKKLKSLSELRNMIHTSNWSKKRLQDLRAYDVAAAVSALDIFIANLR